MKLLLLISTLVFANTVLGDITNKLHFSGGDPWVYLSEVKLQTNVQVIMDSRQPDKGFLATNIWLMAGPGTGTGNVFYRDTGITAKSVTFDIEGNYIGFGKGITNGPIKSKPFIQVNDTRYIKLSIFICWSVGLFAGMLLGIWLAFKKS